MIVEIYKNITSLDQLVLILRKKHRRAKKVYISTELFKNLLKHKAAQNYFDPETSYEKVLNGEVGFIFGAKVFTNAYSKNKNCKDLMLSY